MIASNLVSEIEQWHQEEDNEKIIAAILNIPSGWRNYELIGLLARACNNSGDYEAAIHHLMSVQDWGKVDPLWHFRMGYAYFYSGNFERAFAHFKKTYELNPNEPDLGYFLQASQENAEAEAGFIVFGESDYWSMHLENSKLPDLPIGGKWTSRPLHSIALYMAQSASMLLAYCVLAPFDGGENALPSNLILKKGYAANGYGWEAYILSSTRKAYPELSLNLLCDTDSKICIFCVKNSLEQYRMLLAAVSDAVRTLFRADCIKDAVDLNLFDDMIQENLCPGYLVERLMDLFEEVDYAIYSGIALGGLSWEDILMKFDEAVEKVNGMQHEFLENGDIGESVWKSVASAAKSILDRYGIGISPNIALRYRGW
ncbi:MAG: tetratricopeptide repeat protein [Clostridiales bacterium]|jgi:tetratricopeptide (TPR) repeat protein|nr:tetratricopeptide repeat protein [Clostridiales bacterium]